MHTQTKIKEPLFSSNNRVEDFLVASHWCKNADLMMADGAEANKGSPWELLNGGKKGPTRQCDGNSKRIR
jgi:hypothetical protein